jgi:hypothetical protein
MVDDDRVVRGKSAPRTIGTLAVGFARKLCQAVA